MASFICCAYPAPPRLRFSTTGMVEVAKFAPKTTPHAIAELSHSPELAKQTFIGRMPAAQLMPAMPTPLLPMAAAIPATCVPCMTLTGVPTGSGGIVQLVPVNILPLNSGCVLSTSVSTTAMTELGLPVVISHAAGALIFCGPHCLEKNGSLGVRNRW